MFEAFHRLYNWLHVNGIEAPVAVHFVTDVQTADHIGRLLRNEANDLVFGQTGSTPIQEGQLYGIHFRIMVEKDFSE